MLSANQITAVVLLALSNAKMPRNPHTTLSDREISAIALKSAGHGNSNIGKRLGVSHTAIGKYFKKSLVRACLQQYVASGGKELYPPAVYADREAKQAAKIDDQRIKYFRNWLLRSFVHLGTLEEPDAFSENLNVILDETKDFWADYFKRYEPELGKAEIEGFFRKE